MIDPLTASFLLSVAANMVSGTVPKLFEALLPERADGVNPVRRTIFQLSPDPRFHAPTPPRLPT